MKRQAVRNMIFRLGLHVKPEQIVRALAEQGVQVSLELVRQVHFEILKRSMAAAKPAAVVPRRPAVRRLPKGFPHRRKRG